MVDKERFEAFLRSLLGVLTVAWLVVALASPPDPLTFFVSIVPAWLVGTAAAAWLVYAGGWDRLAASGLFRPVVSVSKTTLLFVVLAVVLKVAGTAATNVLLGEGAVGYATGVATSALALAVAYAGAFLTGPDTTPIDGTLVGSDEREDTGPSR